ncbi:MAG: hypothetical protein RBU23_00310 [Candidatus Auribacterota bacterium]|jgi:hypothetical protein|nr:hypothetical protein [Candidatus Auribacterota bacterium]
MDKYEISEDEFGRWFSLKANWELAFKEVIIKNRLSNLHLCHFSGWRDTNIDFVNDLFDLTFINRVHIFKWGIQDLTPLYHLKHLTKLFLEVNLKKEFDLSKFPNLEDLSIIFVPKYVGLSECYNLEYLCVDRYPYESFVEIAKLKKLKKLHIISRKLVSTKGISNFKDLHTLHFYDCRKLVSLEELDTAVNLTSIELSACKHIEDFEIIGNLKHLDTLILENCGELKNIRFLEKCKKLRRLFLFGTYVGDRDLSVITELPNLQDAAFAERRDNSLTTEQIKKILEQRKK